MKLIPIDNDYWYYCSGLETHCCPLHVTDGPWAVSARAWRFLQACQRHLRRTVCSTRTRRLGGAWGRRGTANCFYQSWTLVFGDLSPVKERWLGAIYSESFMQEFLSSNNPRIRMWAKAAGLLGLSSTLGRWAKRWSAAHGAQVHVKGGQVG